MIELQSCNHLNTVPEFYRGGFSPNEHGESHYLGGYDGVRCLDCKEWFRKRTEAGNELGT